jgi:hypothetical protein
MSKLPSPNEIAKSNTEDAHQIALFAWASQNISRYPQLRWLHAIPNGERRDKITAARLKMAGVKSGVWDIFLPVTTKVWAGLYIEMKRPKSKGKPAGKLSEKQIDFGKFVHNQGYKTDVAYSWQEAADHIEAYLF